MSDMENATSDLDITLTQSDMGVIMTVDTETERSLVTGDIMPLLELGRVLRRKIQVYGLALVKLLASIRDNWQMYESAGVEDSYINVIHAHIGLSPQTIVKYCNLWDSLFANPQIPEDVKSELMSKPLRSLLLLSAAARENQITDWSRIIEAVNHNEVRNVVREARGEHTSSATRLSIFMDVRTGQLAAQLGDNAPENMGFLNVDSTSNVVKMAIIRILHASGVEEV